jgi:drug/metabolite transporter (DMT)-like permease
MTTGYAHLTVATAGILGMLVPVLNTAIGVVLFHEHLSALGLAGVAVVIAACALLALPRLNHRKPTTP